MNEQQKQIWEELARRKMRKLERSLRVETPPAQRLQDNYNILFAENMHLINYSTTFWSQIHNGAPIEFTQYPREPLPNPVPYLVKIHQIARDTDEAVTGNLIDASELIGECFLYSQSPEINFDRIKSNGEIIMDLQLDSNTLIREAVSETINLLSGNREFKGLIHSCESSQQKGQVHKLIRKLQMFRFEFNGYVAEAVKSAHEIIP